MLGSFDFMKPLPSLLQIVRQTLQEILRLIFGSISGATCVRHKSISRLSGVGNPELGLYVVIDLINRCASVESLGRDDITGLHLF